MPKLYKPCNFRTNNFHLMGEDLTIAAMSGLHNHGEHQEGILNYLQSSGVNRKVLIGLHETEDYTELTNKAGIDYFRIVASDYAPIPPETFDKIYDIILKANSQGKQVTVCCGEGNGRSGTTLAAIKVRELLERAVHCDRSILDEESSLTEQAHPSQEGEDPLDCTSMVREAITEIRMHRGVLDGICGEKSVETQSDVESLIAYEIHLRTKMKEEFRQRETKEQGRPAVEMSLLSTAKMSLLLAGGEAEAKKQLSHQSGFDDAHLSSGYGTSTESLAAAGPTDFITKSKPVVRGSQEASGDDSDLKLSQA